VYKLALTRRLYRGGLNRQEVINLYAFVDWLLVLPEALEVAYLEDIQQLEEKTKMRYVTSAERIGRQRGWQEGRREGRQEGQRELLEQLLAARFGRLLEWVAGKLAAAEPARLAGWARQVLTAESLEAVFAEGK
jgi:predicted transposase YdaD